MFKSKFNRTSTSMANFNFWYFLYIQVANVISSIDWLQFHVPHIHRVNWFVEIWFCYIPVRPREAFDMETNHVDLIIEFSYYCGLQHSCISFNTHRLTNRKKKMRKSPNENIISPLTFYIYLSTLFCIWKKRWKFDIATMQIFFNTKWSCSSGKPFNGVKFNIRNGNGVYANIQNWKFQFQSFIWSLET